MRLGIDVSTYYETLKHNAKYYDGSKEVEPISMLFANGVDCMRIRLWVDPYDEHGNPYLGGTCDLNNALKLCKLAKDSGYGIMLDFHYSDFWADPSKQFVPKAWRTLTFEQLVLKVKSYTEETLRTLKQNGVDLEYIQVGNEITNGMLWDYGKLTESSDGGKRGNYGNFIALIKAGISSCRLVYPNAKIILHLERSHDQQVYNEFFTETAASNVDYDVIAFSYYPYWHGTFEQFFANVDMCKKFGKELVVTELGYAFTVEPFIVNKHGGAKIILGNEEMANAFSKRYPITPQGQADFVTDFLALAKQHGVSMVCWWEPLWLHGDGTQWASVYGEQYTGETDKPTHNEWANQCLFDYQGQKLPAFDCFKKQ